MFLIEYRLLHRLWCISEFIILPSVNIFQILVLRSNISGKKPTHILSRSVAQQNVNYEKHILNTCLLGNVLSNAPHVFL